MAWTAHSSLPSQAWLCSRGVGTRMHQGLTHAASPTSSYELAPDDLFQPPEDARLKVQDQAMLDGEALYAADEADEGEEQAAEGWLSSGAAYVNEDGVRDEGRMGVGESWGRCYGCISWDRSDVSPHQRQHRSKAPMRLPAHMAWQQ